jgi:hypothetical protein
VRRTSAEAGRPLSVPEVIIPLEGLHRAYPKVTGSADDELARMLEPWVVK